MAVRLNECRSGELSQHGEHGVIEAVFREIGVTNRCCVEFGAYDLKHFSNVYPFWSQGWRALLLEGDPRACRRIRADFQALPGHEQLQVEIAQRSVAPSGPDSLDNILDEHGFPEDPDLVVIDVDGIDLHIWRGLQRHRPRLVVVEYNPTIPPHLEIIGAESGNHIGCSALALHKLGQLKGYSLVACIAWNAFFVPTEYAHHFADADNLEALFDRKYLRYAMQSYHAEVFYSSPLHLKEVPLFSRDSDAIETSTQPVGKVRHTVASVQNLTMRHCLRPAKRLLMRAIGR